ncbi:MAG: hypothetical protein Q4E86_07595 [Lachnospiraceae bacterium]|nr:hypothetical protein [Lachnospiraceae bacterium]
MEDKQKNLNLLLPALQATDDLKNLKTLEYDPDLEIVIAVFADGSRKGINAARDSGLSMIRNLLRQLM